MRKEIQRIDAKDEQGIIYTILEYQEVVTYTSVDLVPRTALFKGFFTARGDMVYPMGNGRYKILSTNKVVRKTSD
jgi:hypothetical protein